MHSARLPGIAVLVLSTAALSLGVMCGGDGGTSGDGGVDCNDPRVDCLFDVDIPPIPKDSGSPVDSGPACALPAANADGTISDWPDWRRLTELDPCCPIDVARNPATDMPPLRWVSCFDAMNCQMLDLPPRPEGLPPQLGALVSSDSTGVAKTLAVGRALGADDTQSEIDLYDLSTGNAIGGWRTVAAASAVGLTTCSLQYDLSRTRSSELVSVQHGKDALTGHVAIGSLATLTSAPVYRALPVSGYEGEQDFHTSDSIFAYDDPFQGNVVRCGLDSLSCVSRKGGPAVALLLDFVSGTDVYATSIHGDSGWAQEYGMAADGTISLFRGNPSAHILSVATDGTTLAWTETSGTINIDQPQTETDVWSAPYTSNAATLSTSAHKVTTLPQATTTGGPILVGGYYSLYVLGEIDVVRLADGATQRLTAPSGYIYGNPIYVSATEVWAPLNIAGASVVVALLRVPLEPWSDL